MKQAFEPVRETPDRLDSATRRIEVSNMLPAEKATYNSDASHSSLQSDAVDATASENTSFWPTHIAKVF